MSEAVIAAIAGHAVAAMIGEFGHGRNALGHVHAGLQRFRDGAGRHGSFDAVDE